MFTRINGHSENGAPVIHIRKIDRLREISDTTIPFLNGERHDSAYTESPNVYVSVREFPNRAEAKYANVDLSDLLLLGQSQCEEHENGQFSPNFKFGSEGRLVIYDGIL